MKNTDGMSISETLILMSARGDIAPLSLKDALAIETALTAALSAQPQTVKQEDCKALFEECQLARDEIGFLGSVPDCIRYLDAIISRKPKPLVYAPECCGGAIDPKERRPRLLEHEDCVCWRFSYEDRMKIDNGNGASVPPRALADEGERLRQIDYLPIDQRKARAALKGKDE